jgi:filamentous hemagglutinin
LSGTTANYGVSFDLNKKYHNGFYLRFYYADNPQKEAITIWFYSYENFIKFYQYLGLSLSKTTKDIITASYKQSIDAAKSDCNRLDVIYETIPDFVISEIPDEVLYAGIESLLGCNISHLPGKILLGELNDTDEEKAILNLLSGINKDWLYKKINDMPELIENFIINKMGFRYEKDFLRIISEIAEANWRQPDYENSNYYTLGNIEINLGGSTGQSKARQTGCLLLGKLGEYKFGTQFQTSDDGVLYLDYGGCAGMFETRSLTAILVETENGESGVLPALVVKYLSKQMVNRNRNDFINLSAGLMLPELFISKANVLKIFGKTGVAKGDDIIWNYIKATQEVYPNTVLPKSFELTTPTNKIWVHPNATEHIAEFIQMKAVNYTPEAVRLATQEQLKSLHAAVSESIKNGITYDKLLEIGGWELRFSPAREAGQLPALIHALPK